MRPVSKVRALRSSPFKPVCLCVLILVSAVLPRPVLALNTLIPMEADTQRDHLKAYGVAYWALQAPRNYTVEWLLNYRGGAFLVKESEAIPSVCRIRGVSYQLVDDAVVAAIHQEVEQANMEVVLLEKAPHVAVYAPPENEPWDDAVRLALEYADIPYTLVYDPEVLAGRLPQFDWLHLHHEDFTAQYGKFYRTFHTTPWYQEKVQRARSLARELGFPTVAALKRATALAIKGYVADGGFLFAMCSATDTLDIALAANGMDIIPPEIDGTPIEPGVQARLDYDQSLAFENFRLVTNALEYEHSDIDVEMPVASLEASPYEYFTLFEFSAKIDPIPTMLVQCHTSRVKDFRGQCSGFNKERVKKKVIVLGEMPGGSVLKYIHGNYGTGTFTFLSGHDPEDYAHQVGEDATDLSLFPNSPGYRLILNNILFPAARKKRLKT